MAWANMTLISLERVLILNWIITLGNPRWTLSSLCTCYAISWFILCICVCFHMHQDEILSAYLAIVNFSL